jgi:hypothetical protein
VSKADFHGQQHENEKAEHDKNAALTVHDFTHEARLSWYTKAAQRACEKNQFRKLTCLVSAAKVNRKAPLSLKHFRDRQNGLSANSSTGKTMTPVRTLV